MTHREQQIRSDAANLMNKVLVNLMQRAPGITKAIDRMDKDDWSEVLDSTTEEVAELLTEIIGKHTRQ